MSTNTSTVGVARPSRPMRVRSAAFDLRKTGVARYDLNDPYHVAVTISWPAFVVAALIAVAALNTVFAFLLAQSVMPKRRGRPHLMAGRNRASVTQLIQ